MVTYIRLVSLFKSGSIKCPQVGRAVLFIVLFIISAKWTNLYESVVVNVKIVQAV